MATQTQISDYSIIQVISETKESQVSLAECGGKRVILKKMLTVQEGNRDNMLFRLRREGEILQASFSDTVVELLDIVEDGDQIYLVMEYYEGRDLNRMMAELDFSQKLQAFILTAQALGKIHANDIVHRDIKPHNILLKTEPELQIKMIDFGLAYIKNLADVFQQGTVVGTLAYLSPEQTGLLKRPIDNRTDLYSLGAAFYQVFCGRQPFDEQDPLKLIHAHLSRQPEVPSQVSADVPGVLDGVLLKLLQKEPAERYQSADALLHDLLLIQKDPSSQFTVGQADETKVLNLNGRVIGREQEVAQIQSQYELAQQAQPQAMVVRGRSGMGKSKLIEGFIQQLDISKAVLLQFSCLPESQNVPFVAMRSLLDQLFQQPVQVAMIPSLVQESADDIALLRPFLPQVILDYVETSGAVVGEVSAPGPQEMLQAVQRFFSRLVQADSTLILYLDDIQWADKASLEIFSSLSRDLKDAKLFLLASVREEEQDEEYFTANPHLVLLDLHELALDRLPELVGSVLGQPDQFSKDFYHKLAQDSLGNTFYVIEIIRALIEKKILQRAVGQWKLDEKAYQAYEFRVDMTGLINLRLTGFSASELQVLISAAVIGRQFSLDFLLQLEQQAGREISLDALLLIIDKARKELLLEEAAGRDAGVFVFMHDKIAEVLRSRATAAEREQRHEQCAQVLLSTVPKEVFGVDGLIAGEGAEADHLIDDQRVPIYQLAYHFNNTNNTAAKLRCNFFAYQRALQQQSRKEAVFYAGAICDEYRKKPETIDADQLDFMIKTSHLMQQVGYLAQSLELLHYLLASVPDQLLGEKRIDILLNVGTAYHWQNQLGQALSYYKQAVDLAEQSGKALSSWRPYHLLANTCFFESKYSESVHYFTRALELIPAEATQDYLMSLAVRLYAYYFLGRIKEAEADKLELERRLDEVPNLAYRANFYHSLALCFNWDGNNEKGLQFSLLSSQDAKNAGLMLSTYSALFSRMLAYFFTEKHKELHQAFREAVEIAEKNGITVIIESYWSFQAFSDLLQENFEAAQEIIDDFLPRSAASENKFAHVLFLYLQAAVHFCYSRLNAAEESLNQAWMLCRERELDICSPWVLELRKKLAEVRQEDAKARELQKTSDDLLQEKSGLAFLHSHAVGVVQRLEGYRQSKMSFAQGDSSVSVFKEKLQLENIVKTSQMISSILKIDVLLNSVLQAMMETTGAQRGVLKLLGYQAEGSPFIFSNIGPDDNSFSAIQDVLLEQEKSFESSVEGVVVSSDQLSDSHVLSAVCCPLVIKGKPIGMVYLDSQYISDLFSQEELRLLSIFTTQAAIAIENAISFEKEKEARSNAEATLKAFQLFVPPQFMSAIASEGIDKIRLGNAVEREVSILFCDIRNFTAISESMKPETLMAFLNTYMETMVGKSIAENGGFIDKFIGDAVMAIFENDYSDGALQTAVDIQRTLAEYNAHLSMNEQNQVIRAGVGLNTGTVIMGTVGTHARMDSTIIGDEVNIAARLEGLSKMYGVPIVVSASTIQRLLHPENFSFRKIDSVVVKGKALPVTIYEVFSWEPEWVQQLKIDSEVDFMTGVSKYRAGDFAEAQKAFQRCLDGNAEDAVAAMYVKRCQEYADCPPDGDWDGCIRLDRK